MEKTEDEEREGEEDGGAGADATDTICSLHSLKYLLSGPLQKKSADPRFKGKQKY